jgi:hypothetical protein
MLWWMLSKCAATTISKGSGTGRSAILISVVKGQCSLRTGQQLAEIELLLPQKFPTLKGHPRHSLYCGGEWFSSETVLGFFPGFRDWKARLYLTVDLPFQGRFATLFVKILLGDSPNTTFLSHHSKKRSKEITLSRRDP